MHQEFHLAIKDGLGLLLWRIFSFELNDVQFQQTELLFWFLSYFQTLC